MKLQRLMQYFITQISEAISSCMYNRHNIIAQQLYNLTNEKLGFVFDFRVCNVPDFCQFLIYYCHQIINLQFINGTFVAFPKHMGYIGFQYQNTMPMYYQNNQFNNNGYVNSQGYYNNNQNFYQNQNSQINKQNINMNNQYDKHNQFTYGNGMNNYGNNFNNYYANNNSQNCHNYQGGFLSCPPNLYKTNNYTQNNQSQLNKQHRQY